ncbi:MAG: PEGA domain-containing protein, partial [Bacteroidaceae bacterium]|nr:PEGA domain-containing protein [Bacteroidaceae bacterium]
MRNKVTVAALLLVLLLFAALPVAAQQMQKFHVESFEENPFDMSAREKPTSRDDGTGTLYAIIKVRSTVPEDDLGAYKFDFDYLKDVEEKRNGVLWVYVQNGAKTMNIEREGFYPVQRYNLGTTLQPGKVYDLVLRPQPKVISMQFLMFKVSPADSEATIMYTNLSQDDGEKKLGDIDSEGSLAKKLVLGRYAYRVISESYHTSEGIVTLTEPDGKHIETVTLRPNFAHITLTVGNGAEIYINDERRGTGQWSGNLAPGTYSVECRKANHKSTLETITVEDGKNTTYTLKAPTPIVGNLS